MVLPGHIDSALDAYETARAIFEDYEDDLNTTKTLNNMASIFRKTGHLNKAVAIYESCLECVQRVQGDHSNEAAQVLRNLGGVLSDLNQTARATECWRKSQEISIALHGTENMDAAATIAAQADMQLGRGHLHESLAGHAEALVNSLRMRYAMHGADIALATRLCVLDWLE